MPLSVVLLGCWPTIHYLGDNLPPTTSVDLYYDAKAVKKEYKVIGRMTNDQFSGYNVQTIKKQMIKKAKKVGAEGIIFSDLSVESSRRVVNSSSQGGELAVKAELIKYQ